MSDFTVLRSLDGYCLVLDNKRIAGGKPDYRGENVLVDWTTEVVYGPVDDIAAENAELRSICAEVAGILFNLDVDYCGLCDRDNINHPCPVHTVKGGECLIESELCELGVEVDA